MAKTSKRDQAMLNQLMELYERDLAFDLCAAKQKLSLINGLERVRNGGSVEAVIESYGYVGESIAIDLRNEQLNRNVGQAPFKS